MWIVVLGRINPNDMFQKRRPKVGFLAAECFVEHESHSLVFLNCWGVHYHREGYLICLRIHELALLLSWI